MKYNTKYKDSNKPCLVIQTKCFSKFVKLIVMLCISSANETVKPLLPMCSVEVMLNLIPLKKKKKVQGRKLFKTKMFSIKSSLKFSSTKWPLSPFILHFVPKDGKMRENNIQRCGILKLRYFKKCSKSKPHYMINRQMSLILS